jgi:hypothetical protein
MFTSVILALTISTQESSASHFPSTHPKILTLIDAGLSHSVTFRSVIAMLNESDVIVHIGPNPTREVVSRSLTAYQALAGGAAGQFKISLHDEPLPEPVAEAIRLLGWSVADVPRIAVVDTKPPHLADNVEAWVVFEKELARPLIYMRSDIDVYREAGRGDYQARVRLAGILAHERWHLRYGRDEVGAYAAQLAIMEYLHANSLSLAAVRMAFQRVVREAQRGAGTSK